MNSVVLKKKHLPDQPQRIGSNCKKTSNRNEFIRISPNLADYLPAPPPFVVAAWKLLSQLLSFYQTNVTLTVTCTIIFLKTLLNYYFKLEIHTKQDRPIKIWFIIWFLLPKLAPGQIGGKIASRYLDGFGRLLSQVNFERYFQNQKQENITGLTLKNSSRVFWRQNIQFGWKQTQNSIFSHFYTELACLGVFWSRRGWPPSRGKGCKIFNCYQPQKFRLEKLREGYRQARKLAFQVWKHLSLLNWSLKGLAVSKVTFTKVTEVALKFKVSIEHAQWGVHGGIQNEEI